MPHPADPADLARQGGSPLNRRSFLQRVSAVAAGSVLAPRFGPSLGAMAVPVPARSSQALETFVRPVFEPAMLRTLATTAIDAARQAGATWADIRLGDRRAFGCGQLNAGLTVTCGFGLRVRVNGAAAFVGGSGLTTDTVVAAARSAVATARGLARTATTASDGAGALAPVPVVTGEWATPIAIDPFAVSVDDHVFVAHSVESQWDGLLSRTFQTTFLGYYFTRETRVFASSEGSLVTQVLSNVETGSDFRKMVWGLQPFEDLVFPIPGIHPCAGGFEVAVQPNRVEHLQVAAEALARYAELPSGTLDVGRHDVVLDGRAHAYLVGEVILSALSLDRALGHQIDLAGTSFLAPPEEVVGTRVFSPLFSCAVAAGMPNYGAARWDDEGVATTALPLIDHGTVVNYLSDRTTFPARPRVAAVSSSTTVPGLARTTDFDVAPYAMPPAVTVPAAATPAPLDALARQLGKGLLVHGAYVAVDPRGYGGWIMPAMMCEVRGGVPVRRVFGSRLMFSTKRFLATLSAVGDASTLDTTLVRTVVPGLPWRLMSRTVTAPAALYHNADVVSSSLPSA